MRLSCHNICKQLSIAIFGFLLSTTEKCCFTNIQDYFRVWAFSITKRRLFVSMCCVLQVHKKENYSPLPCEIGRNEKSIAIFFTFTVPSPCLLNVNVNLMTTKCSTNSFLLRIHFIVCSHLLPFLSYFYVHVFAPYFISFHLDIAKLCIYKVNWEKIHETYAILKTTM